MMIDVLFLDQWVILAATAPVCNVTAVMNSAILHEIAPTRFLYQKYHTTKTDLIQGHDTPVFKGTYHTPPTMDTHMGDISTDHNHTTISTTTEAAVVQEGTHHTSHLDTAVAHATLWLMDAPIATHTMTHPRGIVANHPTLTTCHMNVTHTTMLQQLPLHCTGNTANEESQATPKTFNPHKSHYFKTVIIKDSPWDSSSGSDDDSDSLNY